MLREEVLERAPYPAEPMRPLPTKSREDDYDLEDMLGTDTEFFDSLPVGDRKEYGQSDMKDMQRRYHAHHLKTAFTGIVRGSIRPNELRFDGPWLRIREMLSVFNDYTKSRWEYTQSLL